LKSSVKSHFWSQNLQEQKTGSGTTAQNLRERSCLSHHGSCAPRNDSLYVPRIHSCQQWCVL